jgi:phospholipase D1/2
MFLPTSNRLAGFMELSALSISLAKSGGAQYKAGYLWIAASGNKGAGFGRKSASRSHKRKQKWCAIRDSYLVAVEEPGELVVWDVFLLDAEFKIKRPTRYYRQGLSLLQSNSIWDNEAPQPDQTGSTLVGRPGDGSNAERKSLLGSIRSRVSHILHPRHEASHAGPSSLPDDEREQHVRSDTDADSLDPDSRPPTPLLDPSTNTDPLNEDAPNPSRPQEEGSQKKKKRTAAEVSRHTFYIKNSQMRLKLYARNEVRMTLICTAWHHSVDETLKDFHWLVASDAAVDCRA